MQIYQGLVRRLARPTAQPFSMKWLLASSMVAFAFAMHWIAGSQTAMGAEETDDAPFVKKEVQGWRVRIDKRLLETDEAKVQIALKLLEKQLTEIVELVPDKAVKKLQQVPLFFSMPYSETAAKAEYHPSAAWLRSNGRDDAMAKGIEFTNISIYEEETERMPNFPLHELAHAFHDRVLKDGFQNEEISRAFERAKLAGKYEKVERWFGNGRANTREKAYALTNPMEFFAEATESFFVRNDYYPFDRQELEDFDPDTCALIENVWK